MYNVGRPTLYIPLFLGVFARLCGQLGIVVNCNIAKFWTPHFLLISDLCIFPFRVFITHFAWLDSTLK